ncbi:MAG: CCA tRNA nucleotidyltransferase [Actinomycetota bacterium]
MLSHSLSALSPNYWPFDLECLPQPAYLVGGAVRDALLGRVSEYLDLDFVVLAGALKTARKVAEQYHAGFVLLDAERQIARVVFERATADFAQAEGGSLEVDLWRRDFRVNAIAYNPRTGETIDPLDGATDLQQRIIRMVSRSNLEDDPLRLLRAYRQAAQLGFAIAPDTLSAIRELAPLLRSIAVERVRTELGYLLQNPLGIPWICRAIEDGLLSGWFPTASDRFDRLAKIEASATTLATIWPALGGELSRWVRDTIKTPLLAVAKLAILVNPDPAIAEGELMALKYSNVEMKATLALLKYLPKLQVTTLTQTSVREQYFLFKDLGAMFPALAVLAVAVGVGTDEISRLVNRYFNLEDPVAHPTQLVSGNEVMTALNLPRSPLIGKLLLEIQLARIEGKITNREEALKWVAELAKTL